MQKLLNTLLIILLSSVTATLSAAPIAYSINSDSPSGNADSLYRINLQTGQETLINKVISLGESRSDIEGLAFAPDGTLYAINDSEPRTLFPLNPDNGVVFSSEEVLVSGLQTGGNDFGMTFACDNNLYVTSIAKGALYRLELDGDTTLIGAEGSLNVKINALAAYGENPITLYGLGNGMDENQQVTTPNLYTIDIGTGSATLVGPLGNEAGNYSQGGLSFDDSGQLWAITDRRELNLPSQVMKIDTATGTASAVQETEESGFESLAITVPRGCATNGGPNATFKVQKQFTDGNDTLPVTLNISCNAGTPLQQSITVQPNNGSFGTTEVTFTVSNFEDGKLNCNVTEDTPANYLASYTCFSTGACTATESACSFSNVTASQDNLCAIRNSPKPFTVNVITEWPDSEQDLVVDVDEEVQVELTCRNVVSGDGQAQQDDMVWSWLFDRDASPQAATFFPSEDEQTDCRTETKSLNSSIESISNCSDWVVIDAGSGTLDCVIVNTVFFEGIPALSRGGLLLFSVLMLFTGMAFVRRF